MESQKWLALGVVTATLCFACAASPPERPNVLLITLDTTRADRLGFNGYARATSPKLDRLAAESVVYSQAFATASSTLASHAALFTGKFTSSHGARGDPEGELVAHAVLENLASQDIRIRSLGPDEVTLAQLLRGAGYATGAVVAGPFLMSYFGLDRGFDDYDDEGADRLSGRRAQDVTDRALAWLSARDERPFFLFLNYFDPHGPYKPPEPFLHAFSSGRSDEPADRDELYDAEILYMDHHLGRLFDALRTSGAHERTLIIVTADHGELLGEHGRQGHGRTLYQEEIHVPLLVKAPGRGDAGRVDAPVQLTDVLPLVCDRLGLPCPRGIQGGLPPRVGHPLVAETYPPPGLSKEGDWRVLLEGGWKLHWNSRGRHRLFDLRTDPHEERDRMADEPKRVARMVSVLDAYLEALPKPPSVRAERLDDRTREALEQLGYLESRP